MYDSGVILRYDEDHPEDEWQTSAVPVLLDAAKKHKDLSKSVVIALGQIGPEAKEGILLLLDLLKNQNNDPRHNYIRVQAASAPNRHGKRQRLTYVK